MEPMTNPEAQTASGGARLKKGSAKTPLIVLGVIVAVLALPNRQCLFPMCGNLTKSKQIFVQIDYCK